MPARVRRDTLPVPVCADAAIPGAVSFLACIPSPAWLLCRAGGIEAADGPMGQVKDFLLEESTWAIHYLVVNTNE